MVFLYYRPILPWNFSVLLLRLWTSLNLLCQKNMAEVLACHFQAWDSKGLAHFHLVSCTIEFPFGTLPHPWEQAWESLLENKRPCGGELWCPTQHPTNPQKQPTRQTTANYKCKSSQDLNYLSWNLNVWPTKCELNKWLLFEATKILGGL